MKFVPPIDDLRTMAEGYLRYKEAENHLSRSYLAAELLQTSNEFMLQVFEIVLESEPQDGLLTASVPDNSSRRVAAAG